MLQLTNAGDKTKRQGLALTGLPSQSANNQEPPRGCRHPTPTTSLCCAGRTIFREAAPSQPCCSQAKFKIKSTEYKVKAPSTPGSGQGSPTVLSVPEIRS